MIVAVAIVGAASWFLLSAGHVRPIFDAHQPAIAAFFGATLLVAGVAVVFFRRMRARSASVSRNVSLTIVAWSAGEGAAVLGAIFFLLSGNVTYYVSGLLLMGMALILVPVQPAPAS
jgi:hypothetical protein